MINVYYSQSIKHIFTEPSSSKGVISVMGVWLEIFVKDSLQWESYCIILVINNSNTRVPFRYQTIQRTMATERRDEESGSPCHERTANTETDSPPQTTGNFTLIKHNDPKTWKSFAHVSQNQFLCVFAQSPMQNSLF